MNLDSIKVGDEVSLVQNGSLIKDNTVSKISRVIKVTNTQIITDDNRKWNKSNGKSYSGRYGGPESEVRIVPTTVKHKSFVKRVSMSIVIRKKLSRVAHHMNSVSVNTLHETVDKNNMSDNDVQSLIDKITDIQVAIGMEIV